MDGRLVENSGDAAVEINAIDSFAHLHVRAVVVHRIGEVDSSPAIDADIVGGVVSFPFVPIRQNNIFAGPQIGPSHSSIASRTKLRPLTMQQPPLQVKGLPIGPATWLTVDGPRFPRPPFDNPIANDVRKIDSAVRVHCWTFGKSDGGGNARLADIDARRDG